MNTPNRGADFGRFKQVRETAKLGVEVDFIGADTLRVISVSEPGEPEKQVAIEMMVGPHQVIFVLEDKEMADGIIADLIDAREKLYGPK